MTSTSKRLALTTRWKRSQEEKRELVDTTPAENQQLSVRKEEKRLDQEPVVGHGSERKRLANLYRWMTYAYLPYRLILDDEYLTQRLYHRNAAPAPASVKSGGNTRKGDSKSHRITDFYRTCLAGCKEPVHIEPHLYDAKHSNYLICSDTCTDPIAAHKSCIRERLAESWKGRFVCGCEVCHGEIRMTGVFRLGPRQLPYTLVEMVISLVRHLIFWPAIWYLVFRFLVFLGQWFDYNNGLRDDSPGLNPFRDDFSLYSATDPDFEWVSSSLHDRWAAGFLFYAMMWVFWRLGVRWVCGGIWRGTRRLLWRFEGDS